MRISDWSSDVCSSDLLNIYNRLVDFVDVVQPRCLNFFSYLRIREARYKKAIALLHLLAEAIEVGDDELETFCLTLASDEFDHRRSEQIGLFLAVKRVFEQPPEPGGPRDQIGRASWRARVLQSV